MDELYLTIEESVNLGDMITQPLTVTANGVYKGGEQDGKQVVFDEVNVNVPLPVSSLNVTENGTYKANEGEGFNEVNVNVPLPVKPLNVTENGTYTANEGEGFNEVNVNVSVADVIKQLIKFRNGYANSLFTGATGRTIEEWNEIVKYDTTEDAIDLSNALHGVANNNSNVTIRTFPLFDTRKCKNFTNFVANNQTIHIIPAYDFRSGTTLTSAFVGIGPYEIWIKNIKANLSISQSKSLKLECLIHLIKELRDTGSAKTLTVGSANIAKLTGDNAVYVKLVPITDEMRAEDDLIDEKLPFVVCEPTDEGATLITEYALQKNWQIAG